MARSGFAYWDGRTKFRRTWTLCMTPADAAAFSDALKAEFPNIRFVSEEYWSPFVDWSRFKDHCWEDERRWEAKVARADLDYGMRDPAGEPLHYWPSLADPAETNFWAWLEPPGWRPVWEAPGRWGIRELANMPQREFFFRRSEFQVPRVGARSFNDEPAAIDNRESIFLRGTTFEVIWNQYDEDGKVFANSVFKVLQKLTFDRVIGFERKSRKAFSRETARQPSFCLVGRDAAAWTLKRRHNYLNSTSGGPLMKADFYPLRRRDVFTAAECARHEARMEAELDELMRQATETSKRRSAEWRKERLKRPA